MISPRQKIKVFISSICGVERYDKVRLELKKAIESTQLAEVYLFEGAGASTLSAGTHALVVDAKRYLGRKLTSKICSIKGVPLIIQINTFKTYFIGLNLDIEPKDMIKPSGSARTRVTANSRTVLPNPCKRLNKISPTIIIILRKVLQRKTDQQSLFQHR